MKQATDEDVQCMTITIINAIKQKAMWNALAKKEEDDKKKDKNQKEVSCV